MNNKFLEYLEKEVSKSSYYAYSIYYRQLEELGLENLDKTYDEIRKMKTTKQNNLIKVLIRYAKWKNLDKNYRLTKIDLNDRKEREQYLKIEDILKMIRGAKTIRIKAEIATMYGTGIRIGEIIKVKHNNIDGINKKIFGIKGKGNKLVNSYFIDNYFYNILNDYMLWKKNDEQLKEFCNQEDYLFCVTNGRQITKNAIFKDIKKAAQVLEGKKSISPHTLRHSFVYKAMEEGIPQDVISKNIGHSSTFVTETVYTHYTQDLHQKRFFGAKNNNKEKTLCPECGYDEIEDNFLYCPQCQYQFKTKCSCNQNYKISYRFCPFCRQPNVNFSLKQINKINFLKEKVEKIRT